MSIEFSMNIPRRQRVANQVYKVENLNYNVANQVFNLVIQIFNVVNRVFNIKIVRSETRTQ